MRDWNRTENQAKSIKTIRMTTSRHSPFAYFHLLWPVSGLNKQTHLTFPCLQYAQWYEEVSCRQLDDACRPLRGQHTSVFQRLRVSRLTAIMSMTAGTRTGAIVRVQKRMDQPQQFRFATTQQKSIPKDAFSVNIELIQLNP